MRKYFFVPLIILLFLGSCETEEPNNTLFNKLENTVWVEDENSQQCPECGFAGVVGFKGGKIYELSRFSLKEPTGCFPDNFWVRYCGGKFENYIVNKNKI